MVKKKYKGENIEKLLTEIDWDAIMKEVRTMLTRQKQRYAINTLLEQYEITVSVEVKKERKR